MKRATFVGVLLIALTAGCQSDAVGPTPDAEGLTLQRALAGGGHGVSGSATGSAHLTVPDFPPTVPPGLALRNFAFSAVTHADGSVSGEWQIVAGASILHGPIDCLTIAPDGASARISGLVTNALFTFFDVGTAFAMELVDNGPAGTANPDVTSNLRAFRNAPPEVGRTFCEDGTIPEGADLQPLPTEHGNFTIRVAQ